MIKEIIEKNFTIGNEFQRLYNDSKQKKCNFKIDITNAKINCPTLSINDSFVHSSYNPLKEAERFGSGKIENRKILFVLGLGLGYHVKSLLNKIDSNKTKVIVIETSHVIFRYAFENTDLSFLKNTYFYLGNSNGLFSYLSNILIEKDCSDAEILPLTGQVKHFEKEYTEISSIINKALTQKLQSYMTTLGFGYKWISNIVRNINKNNELYTPSSKCNVPVFIIASGPSLNDSLKYIDVMKKKGIVLCLSHSYAALLNNNVSPHAVFSIDGGFASYSHFKGIKDEPSDTILVSTLSVNPHLFKNWKGKKAVINLSLPLEKTTYPDALELPVAGTVAASAFLFAKWISNGPYYFAGLDLAYTNNRYHHKGSLAEETFIYSSSKLMSAETKLKQMMLKFDNVKVKSRDNNKVKTNRAMLSYRDWFDENFLNNEVYLLGNKGIYFNNAKTIDYENLYSLPDLEGKINLKQIDLNTHALKSKLEKILKDLCVDPLLSEEEALQMQFARFSKNKEDIEYCIKKSRKLYENLLSTL